MLQGQRWTIMYDMETPLFVFGEKALQGGAFVNKRHIFRETKREKTVVYFKIPTTTTTTTTTATATTTHNNNNNNNNSLDRQDK
jgi:hypothetical protein